MPGRDYFSSPAAIIVPSTHTPSEPASPITIDEEGSPRSPDSYYNPRLDLKNYLDGPLSDIPATRLRQMLARPGIIVRPFLTGDCHGLILATHRSPPEFATESVLAALWRPALNACIRGRP